MDIMKLGIDIGYSAVKGVAGDRWITFASIVGTPDRGQFSLNGHGAESIVLSAPDRVQVGEAAVAQSRFASRREDRAWIEGPEYRSLFLALLTQLIGATTERICVVTGLPVAFYGDKDLLAGRLSGTHHVTREGRSPQTLTVAQCRVIPQPFGALLSVALDAQGRIVDEGLATGVVGVIDIGGKTTNLLAVNRMAEIGKETTSVSLGAWDAVRAVREHLSTLCPDLELRDHEIIEVIKARQVAYFGEMIDLSPVIDGILEPMAEQVISAATHLWAGGARLNRILIAGGGALLLAPYIESRFRHAQMVVKPVFANALGYWKFAQRLAQASDGGTKK